MTTDRFDVHYLIRRNMDQVMQIERLCFGPHAWTEDDFLDELRNRRVIGHVAHMANDADMVVGYVLKLLSSKRVTITNLAVHPEWQQSGIGTLLLHHASCGMGQNGRNELVAVVRESNLPAQLFMQKHGLLCEEIRHQQYATCDEDAYVFRLRFGDMAIA